jgi:hypothetical protein
MNVKKILRLPVIAVICWVLVLAGLGNVWAAVPESLGPHAQDNALAAGTPTATITPPAPTPTPRLGYHYIHGRVVEQGSGRALTGATTWLYRDDGGWQLVSTSSTNDSGYFGFGISAQSGHYRIVKQNPPGYSSVSATIPPGVQATVVDADTIDLDLTPDEIVGPFVFVDILLVVGAPVPTPIPDTPTTGIPSRDERVYVTAIVWGHMSMPIDMYVAGAYYGTQMTEVNSFGEQQSTFIFWPGVGETWNVVMVPRLPANLDPKEWRIDVQGGSLSMTIIRGDRPIVYLQVSRK